MHFGEQVASGEETRAGGGAGNLDGAEKFHGSLQREFNGEVFHRTGGRDGNDGAWTGGGIFAPRGGAEQAERGYAGSSGEMHQAGIIADIDGAALQAGGGLRDGEDAAQIDGIRQGGVQGGGEFFLGPAGAGEDGGTRT